MLKKTLRRLLTSDASLRLVPYSLLIRLEVEWAFLVGRSPILVYQMGKVGSTTVTWTLRKTTSAPVYHFHTLNEDRLRQQEAFFADSKQVLDTLITKKARVINRAIKRNPARKWRIITLVRDPVAREISRFFQLTQDGEWKQLAAENRSDAIDFAVDRISDRLRRFETDKRSAAVWFDNELKKRFGIDVFAHAFDKETGYSVLRQGNIELLVIRLESLDTCLVPAISELLGVDPGEVVVREHNRGNRKSYADDLKEIKGRIRLPENVCQLVYGSKLVRHFYTGEMRERFIRRWTG